MALCFEKNYFTLPPGGQFFFKSKSLQALRKSFNEEHFFNWISNVHAIRQNGHTK